MFNARILALQTFVGAGHIAEESGERRLEAQAKIHRPIAHSLVNERISARLRDDQIGPLHDDDRDKIRGLTCVLEDLNDVENVSNVRNNIKASSNLSICVSLKN